MSMRTATKAAITLGTLATAVIAGPASPASASTAKELTCRSGHVCGWAANGSSFDYYKCGITYTLPDMVGEGRVINNQTGGAVARFYYKNGNLAFAIGSPNSGSVDWTPIWYAIAC